MYYMPVHTYTLYLCILCMYTCTGYIYYHASIIFCTKDPYVYIWYIRTYAYTCYNCNELILCKLYKHIIHIVCLFFLHTFLYIASSKQRSSLRKAVAQDKKRIEEAVSQYNSILAEVQPTATLLTTEDVMQQKFPWSAITGIHNYSLVCVGAFYYYSKIWYVRSLSHVEYVDLTCSFLLSSSCF